MNPHPFRTISELEGLGQARLQTGPFGTQLKASEYADEGVPVINVRNIGFGDVRKEDLEYLGEAKAEALHQHHLRKGDIVFGRKGAVERHALIDEATDGWIQGSDCLRLRMKSKDVCEKYLSYYFRTQAHQDWMQALCSFGATMTSLNQDIVRRISFPAPPIGTQKKIAAILSAYDELIENNRRRITLLEKMAEEIYREWFVRMRFPGHEQVKIVKGVPERWDYVSVTNIANVRYGKNLPTDKLTNDGLYPVYGAAKIIGKFDQASVNERTIITGCRGSVGQMAITKPKCFVTNNSFTIKPNRHQDFFWLYHNLCLRGFDDVIGGSAQPQITLEGMASAKTILPNSELRDDFFKIAMPIHQQIWALQECVERIALIRNALLPRLISGKLSVEDLDIQFPPSMQETMQ